MSGSEGPASGWYADPTGRHGQRWWDGRVWSDQVADGQAVASDPLVETAPVVATSHAPGTVTGSDGDQRAAIEWAVRDADDGHLPKGWPARYEPVIADVLSALEHGERVLGAWRMRTVGPRQRASDLGLLVITDRHVIGADQSAKSSGLFRVDTGAVSTVELVNRRTHTADLGWELHLLDADGGVLGTDDSPAEVQVFAKGRDPSKWDSHPQGEEDLAAVQRALVRLLPTAATARGELEVTTAAGTRPATELAGQPPPGPVAAPPGGSPVATIGFTPAATSLPGAPARLAVADGATVRPGETMTFRLASEPWPDPKLDHVEVTLAYQSNALIEATGQPLTAVGQLFTPPGPIMIEGTASGAAHDLTVVARGTVPAEQFGASGQVTGSVVVPADAPPTIEDIVNWRLSANFQRRRGMDHHESVTLTVSGLGAEQLMAIRPAEEDSSDWLLRVCDVAYGTYATRLAPVARPRNVWLDLAQPIVEPGGRAAGKLIVRPDAELIAATARRHRKAAESSGQVEMRSLRVTLECWRGSSARETCHRMFHVESEISGPMTVDRGEVREVPFEITVPRSAKLLKSYDSWTPEQPIPGSFLGARVAGAMVDDIRWRVTGQVVPAGRSPQDPTPSSALWDAKEVLVSSR